MNRRCNLQMIFWRGASGGYWAEYAFNGDYSKQMWLAYNHKAQCYVAVPDGANVAFMGQKLRTIGRYRLSAIKQMQRENPEYTWQIIGV